MGEIDNSGRLRDTLERLTSALSSDVEQLEQFRLDVLDQRRQDGVRPGDAPRDVLADVQALARRLERVLDWLETSSDRSAAHSGWETWESRSGAASVPDSGAGATLSDDRWWVPSLVLLAVADRGGRSDTRDMLEQWMRARSQLSHLVVDEIVDGMVDLSASPWPVIDDAGRPRFPIHWLTELAVPIDDLQRVVDHDRERLLELGLTTEELARRPVDLGDVFAAEVSIVGSKRAVQRDVKELSRPDDGAPQLAHAPWAAQVLAVAGHWFDHSTDPEVRTRSGVLTIETDHGRMRIAGPTAAGGRLPIMDVTWDAREQAKLAFAAANTAGGTYAGLVEQVDQQLREQLSGAAADAT